MNQSTPGASRPGRVRSTLVRVAAAMMTGLLVAGCSSAATPAAPASSAPTTRTVTDMAGRSIVLPAKVGKVVTLGSVPVINSFLFALGKGELIGNGLPANFVKTDRWKYQYVFAPHIKDLPQMQGADGTPNVEEIVKANPDVVLTMLKAQAEQLEKSGVKAIVLTWQNDEDVKKVVTLLGDALGVPDRAKEYATTFDDTVAEVTKTVKDVPDASRVTALSLDPSTMGQPHTIAQWWIAKAGGKAVTEGNTVENMKFTAEQVVAWNPQVIFVNDPAALKATLEDPKLATVAAVRNKSVYQTPIAAHTWGNRTSEQPLSVAFAASRLYPDKLPAARLHAITKTFYSTAFHVDLTDVQVDSILDVA